MVARITDPGGLFRVKGPRFMCAVAVLALLALVVITVPTSFAEPHGDVWVYLAAGERLNAHHQLYALLPGDRPVELLPPLWTTPLLSPPPIAVLWRPLATLGEVAMGLWCAGALLASALLVGWGITRGGPWSLIATVLFGPFLLYSAIPGNANAYLAPLLAAAWLRRSNPWLPAISVVAASAVKLTPISLAPWAVRGRRLVPTLIAGSTVLIATLLLANGAIVDWLHYSGQAAPSPLSIAGLVDADGRLTSLLLIAGSWVLASLFRANEKAVFVIGIVAATFATPAFYLHTIALLSPLIVLDTSPLPAARWSRDPREASRP